jgi:plastocyanin
MTWQLAICFSWLPALALAAANISGQVDLGVKDQSNVVVWLEPASGAAAAAVEAPKPGAMLHKNKTFLPHVLPVMVGSKVAFPNRDPWFHNAFSNYDGQIFDIGMHPPGTAREVTFRRAGVVRVFCNIHPTMSAVILVVPTPYFATTDTSGAYRIAGVPPGEYRLHVFHERVLPEKLKQAERPVTIADTDLTLPKLTLSTAGFIQTPHKNKYGKDYPPVIKDVYPGQVP